MYSDYSPNKSPFRNPPENSQCSIEMNHYSDPRLVSKTTTSRSYIERENKGSKEYSPYPDERCSQENNIYIEETERNPFEMAREQPQTEEKYEIHETYENYGNNEDCKIAIITMIVKIVMILENVIDKKDAYIAIITNANIAKIF